MCRIIPQSLYFSFKIFASQTHAYADTYANTYILILNIIFPRPDLWQNARTALKKMATRPLDSQAFY